MTRLLRPHYQNPRYTSDMASSSYTSGIWGLRNLVDQEINKGIRYIKQPAATQMSLSDTISSMVLGLDIQILALCCDEEMRRRMIELAKTTPVLLTYAAGKERQEALQAIWQLQKRAKGVSNPNVRSFYEQPTHQIQKHFLTTKVKEMPIGPRGYAKVEYIPCDMVPLVDYWPDFVRKAFALGCWRFAVGDDEVAEGCDERVVLEIMEGRLDLVEWLIEMEEKREVVVENLGVGAEGRIRGGGRVWPIPSRFLGHQQRDLKEGSKENTVLETAQMMDVLKI